MTLTVSEPSIWVIDPLGNVVLKFEPGINPTLILQDLKKVIEGIEGGLMANNLPLKLATIALFLAVEVVLMGGFTRITDSGLGCPDWLGCFGKMVMTTDTETIAYLQERYPEIHVAVHKGWIEMIHRYIAGGLGLLIMGIAYLGYREKDKTPNYPYLSRLRYLDLSSSKEHSVRSR